jgi:arginyl-tRNA synthetase
LRKATESGIEIPELAKKDINISEKESFLIQMVANYPNVIKDAGRDTSPALISNYVYDLSKEYNQFYHDFPMNKEGNEDLRNFRFVLSKQVAGIIKSGMSLLGVSLPERM